MGKLVPILLALLGLGAGVGSGLALRPAPDAGNEMSAKTAEKGGENPEAAAANPEAVDTQDTASFVKLNNQFVVPVVEHGSVVSLVVLSLSLELASGGPESVYQREPKLRDAMLQVLFDHANSGGFDGNFTSSRNMGQLRKALLEAAQKILGEDVRNVLIVDVVRQDT